MSSDRDAILARLRGALARPDLRFPPPAPPELTAATRMAVTAAPGGAPELARRFAAELEQLHGACDVVGSPAEARLALINRLIGWQREEEAAAKGARIQTGQEKMVLGWASGALPVEHVAESLADMGLMLVTPESLASKESREGVRHIRYGITGVEAAFAATGSLLLAAGPQMGRAASLLPPRHIALVPLTRLFANVETWLAERRIGDLAGWLRSHPSLTLISGPSKSGDIEMILTLGVHGPKHVHVILFDDGAADDESYDAFWRYIPNETAAQASAQRPSDPGERLLPNSFRDLETSPFPDLPPVAPPPAPLTPVQPPPPPAAPSAPDDAAEPNSSTDES